MKVIRKQLSAIEGLPAWQRWDDATGTYQVYDGATWRAAPQLDPRYNTSGRAAPNTRPDKRCAAARGMRVHIENLMEQFWLLDSIIQIASSIINIITLIVPAATILWHLIFAVVQAIWALGSAALVSAFSGNAFARLQCVFWSNIDADGMMSDAQFSAANTEICANFDATVCAALGLLFNALGPVGLSNAGAYYAQDDDCTSCSPPIIDDWRMYNSYYGFEIPSTVVHLVGNRYKVFTQNSEGDNNWFLRRQGGAAWLIANIVYSSYYVGSNPQTGTVITTWNNAYPLAYGEQWAEFDAVGA